MVSPTASAYGKGKDIDQSHAMVNTPQEDALNHHTDSERDKEKLIFAASANVSNTFIKHIDPSLRPRSKGHEEVASVSPRKDGTPMMQEEFFEPL